MAPNSVPIASTASDQPFNKAYPTAKTATTIAITAAMIRSGASIAKTAKAIGPVAARADHIAAEKPIPAATLPIIPVKVNITCLVNIPINICVMPPIIGSWPNV